MKSHRWTVCRLESISELVYCIFKDWQIQYILDSSELCSVAPLPWRKEITHVGVCRDVQEPTRDSDS